MQPEHIQKIIKKLTAKYERQLATAEQTKKEIDHWKQVKG